MRSGKERLPMRSPVCHARIGLLRAEGQPSPRATRRRGNAPVLPRRRSLAADPAAPGPAPPTPLPRGRRDLRPAAPAA